ncbi:MAG: sigma-70 family RNA polymerase sigma factor [Clostridia bacterium]|nr:sigma-70 family RNA polymerase sigma factor [Clostridia bacterium]
MTMEDKYALLCDEAFVELAREDDRAMEYLLGKYNYLVRVKARMYFLMGAERDDVLQEGMIGLFKAVRDYKPGRSTFRAFAELCITRQILSAIKGSQRDKHLVLNNALSLSAQIEQGQGTYGDLIADPTAADPETILAAQQWVDDCMQAVEERLSRREKAVFHLFLEDRSYAEIAGELGCTSKSVDNALQRVKHKLQDLV